MKATVLLATLNGEKYLPEQLESLSSQKESDFRVLYQDDGSTDRTVQILEAWARKDQRFQPAGEQGLHLGAAGNFISLLKQAEGDLFFFCDQDDVWEPSKISAFLHKYRSVGKAESLRPVLIHSDASIIDDSGRITSPSFFRLQGWDPEAVQLSRLLVQNNATGCTMMLNRPLADLVAARGDPSVMFMHDWFIALTAAAFGQILFIDEPLVRYRQHQENVIGASRSSLAARAAGALRDRKKSRDRIALTYSHTRSFREAFGSSLPPEMLRLTDSYLATESMPKLKRIRTVYRLNCVMQSPVTRLGQILFG